MLASSCLSGAWGHSQRGEHVSCVSNSVALTVRAPLPRCLARDTAAAARDSQEVSPVGHAYFLPSALAVGSSSRSLWSKATGKAESHGSGEPAEEGVVCSPPSLARGHPPSLGWAGC